MKDIILKRPWCLAFVLLFVFGGKTLAQTVFKGQLYVNQEHFTRQGEMLRVQLRFSYSDDVLNTGETLNVTPVLKDGKKMKMLSSVVISGRERAQYENRQDCLANRLRTNIAVVTADKKHGSRYFIYDTTIPYSDWMKNASLYVESEERGWGKTPHVYEDLLYAKLNIKDMVSSEDDAPHKTKTAAVKSDWVQFQNPILQDVKVMSVEGVIPLNDELKIGKMGMKRFNRAVMEQITKKLAPSLQIPGTSLKNLEVVGYGAPCGNYKSNESKSVQRAYSLKKYLMENQSMGADEVIVTWVSEDWDTITTLLSQSQMKLKTAALDIIKTVPVVKGREDELRMLGDGAPYSFMKHYVFPKAERVHFLAKFEQLSEGQIANFNDGEQNVSLRSMYATAQEFQVGSREFNDIVDLMARLFPSNAIANINAAGVALMRDDLQLAEKYLSRWKTDSRAYNNLGLLYLQQGDLAKAEVYLQMAEAAGVKEATNVLSYLNNMK